MSHSLIAEGTYWAVNKYDPDDAFRSDDESDYSYSSGELYDEKPITRLSWRPWWRLDSLTLFVVFIGLATFLGLGLAFPFPTTVHVFLAAFAGLTAWTAISLTRAVIAIAMVGLRGRSALKKSELPQNVSQLVTLLAATALVLYWFSIGLVPERESVPQIIPTDYNVPEKYYIAANLYNSEKIFPTWSNEVIKLIDHLGAENTFVSIYESNSDDRTPDMLAEFSQKLTHLGTEHRIVNETTEGRWWPYGQSAERIDLLAQARNRALEPLQSADANVRLRNYNQFTKIIFINDVVFSWQGAVRLLATNLDGEEGYDLACGMDYVQVGLYDLWVARDICGTPMRIVWPHVRDPVSAQRLREERNIEVGACWNGIVAFPAKPYLYQPRDDIYDQSEPSDSSRLSKRAWRMIDNSSYTGLSGTQSPALTTPIKFRTSGIEACDQSECFVFSYDIHRLYPDRRPRIIMNPSVRVAYKKRWWLWRNVVLQMPVVKWWQYYWSHGRPMDIVDFIWEFFTRPRDYCTWSLLSKHAPARCPALPHAAHRDWSEN